jgi:ribosomal protein S18 acetylase RimI-like enzyme
MIRPARLGDLDAVKTCAEQAYAPYVARIGKKPAPMVADFKARIEAGQVYVFERNREILGYIVLYPRRDHLHVENVAVFPGHHGHGIGKALLSFAEDHAKRQRLCAVELYTNAMMTENLVYYPKLGYDEISRREEDGFSRVYFRKCL